MTLKPGRYVVTVVGPQDAAFTAWRMASRASVKVREVRPTADWKADDPSSVTVYGIDVLAPVQVPDDLRVGFGEWTAGKKLEDLFPTSDPSYEPATGISWKGTIAAIALAVAAVGTWLLLREVKRFQ